MAFPTVVDAPVTNSTTTGSTSVVINFPTTTTIAAGDLIIAGVSSDQNNTGISNWGSLTQISQAAYNTNAAYYGLGFRVCTGGETGTTLTWGSERYSNFAIKIGAGTWYGTGAVGTDLFLSTIQEQSSTAPNATSCAPGLGALDFLWITLQFQDGGGSAITTYPTNYTGNQTSVVVASGGGCALATYANNAASEDAGAWTNTTALATAAFTLAIRPASAGGSTVGRMVNRGLVRGGLIGGRTIH